MHFLDLIIKKRNGQKLSEREIKYIVSSYVENKVPDYQMSAFLMAVYFNGMDMDETVALTDAIISTGEIVDLSDIPGKVIDKHSTGGVGDKTTVVVGPILAALNVPVAKMSGRGLGFTGGTIDKLESIPGFRSELSIEEFKDVVKRVRYSDIAQTKNLCYADKLIYGLRDVTGTVEEKSLIASSIMSKKIASGADGIVLDVKVGSGAFMKNAWSAEEIARLMIGIGRRYDKKVTAVLSDMDSPLGRYVGNSLEIIEAMEILKGNGEPRVDKLCKTVAKEMLLLHNDALSDEAALDMVNQVIENGKAIECFGRFVEAQGGDGRIIDDYSIMGEAKYKIDVKAEHTGYIGGWNTELIGQACLEAGSGRRTKEDTIDYQAGAYIGKVIGDRIKTGDTIAVIYTNDRKKGESDQKKMQKAYTITDVRNAPKDVVLSIIK